MGKRNQKRRHLMRLSVPECDLIDAIRGGDEIGMFAALASMMPDENARQLLGTIENRIDETSKSDEGPPRSLALLREAIQKRLKDPQ